MIVLLCGPPASGKTTLAIGLQQRLADRGYAFELLDSDDFPSRTYERMYDRVARSDADWILDGTFYERDIRARFRTLGDVYVVWVRVSRRTALERNRTREGSIPEAGLHVMHESFEPPRADLTIDTDDLSTGAALDRLASAVWSWLDGREPPHERG